MLWVRVPLLVLWIFSLKIEETYTFMNIIFCWAEWNLTNKLRPQIYVCRKNPIWIVNTIGCTDLLRIATKLKYSSHSSKLLAVYFKTCLNSQSTTSGLQTEVAVSLNTWSISNALTMELGTTDGRSDTVTHLVSFYIRKVLHDQGFHCFPILQDFIDMSKRSNGLFREPF